MNKKGYDVFESDSKPFNLNIVGIRNSKPTTNLFNDYISIFWKYEGRWNYLEFQATSLPGLKYLETPMNPKGCAILVPNQYRGVYQIDLHGGKYEALCQRNGKVQVYRDDNKDNFLDLDESTLDEGYFGINIHRSNPRTESTSVDKWSAGCQVFQKKSSYDKFIGTCLKASDLWGDKFTYTLINEKELI